MALPVLRALRPDMVAVYAPQRDWETVWYCMLQCCSLAKECQKKVVNGKGGGRQTTHVRVKRVSREHVNMKPMEQL